MEPIKVNNDLIEIAVWHAIIDHQLDLVNDALYRLLNIEPEIIERIDEVKELRVKLYKTGKSFVKNTKKKEEDLF